ncbi:hypothetical protein GCM10011390_03260 [Aureimonas endophytica]|uniref:Uncharacterized protein n=1 Tax=Aureimonas endophytica TaxID=2027858 RepID=A0A916ZDI5_9HYPH|nr:hypothetical protein [Aureimonas endophytica]GGD87852.1 hypothetical protein GCM10011390_03260 [Aureimonas endophytica]
MTTTNESLKILFRQAHEAARAVHQKGDNYAATFGLALRAAYAALRQPAAPVRERVDVGREGWVDADLEYTNYVRGGGDVTPTVTVYDDYAQTRRLRYDSDGLSGSRRSGWISWNLSENRLYRLDGVSISSSKGATRWVSTFEGVTTYYKEAAAFEAERRRRFPVGFELEKVREEQRRVETEARQRREIEEQKARLERMKIEAAEREKEIAEKWAVLDAEAQRIEAEGQTTTDGLPLLKGSARQVAWALRIRSAVHRREPANAALKRATTASYWIENYRSVLPRI